MTVERPEFEARLKDLAEVQREFRQESGDQHRRLEGKVTDLGEALDVKMAELAKTNAAENKAVIKSIQDDKDSQAEKWRRIMFFGALPVLLVLLGKLL